MNLKTLFRKIRTVILKPKESAQKAEYYWTQWNGRRRLVGLGLADQLVRVEEKVAATGAFPPNYNELLLLYEDIRQRRPNVIFEFGSGLSTNIMAAALSKNAMESQSCPMLYSFESEKNWLDAADEWLDERYRSLVKLVHAPVNVETMFSTKVFTHPGIPDVVPSMVYLDGPGLTAEVKVAADMIALEDRLKPGFWLVVDGRRANVKFLEDHLRRRYKKVVRTGYLGGAFLQHGFELLA